MKKLYRLTALVQGGYTMLTAIWPLLHMESFLAVTGPKTDLWLVKTVAVLLIPISLSLMLQIFFKGHPLTTIVLGLSTAAGLAVIDFYYSLCGIISTVYALDGLLELIFLASWLIVFIKRHRLEQGSS